MSVGDRSRGLELAQIDAAITDLINFNCTFLILTSQNVGSEKDLFPSLLYLKLTKTFEKHFDIIFVCQKGQAVGI